MNISDFAVQLKDLVRDFPAEQQTSALSIAAGYIAGYSMPVFAEKEDLTADSIFVREHLPKIREGLDKLNKVLVIGLADALDVARYFWCLRYRMVHEPTAPETMLLLASAVRDQETAGLPDVIEGVDPKLVAQLATAFANALQGENA